MYTYVSAQMTVSARYLLLVDMFACSNYLLAETGTT